MTQIGMDMEKCEKNARLRWTAVGRQEGIEQVAKQLPHNFE